MSITRRELLSGLAALYAASNVVNLSFASTSAAGDLRVDAARLQRTLEELSVFGRPAGGTFADGVSRFAYSEADVEGRKYVVQLMLDAALDPKVDAAGNIIGRRQGTDSALKPILFGSHIDSVPRGGNFDGQLGSMAAIEVVRTMNDRRVSTRHPLEVVMWSNEEGGTVGSQAVASGLTADDLERHINGIRIGDGIRKIGGDPERLQEARRAPGSFACYLELHIEQGGNLDKAGVPIGVVEGIVCIDEYEVEIRGFANHAGTTPMPERHNALLAAAKMIELVQEVVTREPGRQVGNVGHLEVQPNARNVVPGLVKHTIELRDLSAEKVAALGKEIQRRAPEIARQTQTEISIHQTEHDAPAVATPAIQSQIEAAAASLGLKTMRLPSGAGHDAQNMAKLGPMGMIFVPSVGGVSHSPKELTRWPDCANGANLLLHTLLGIDRT